MVAPLAPTELSSTPTANWPVSSHTLAQVEMPSWNVKVRRGMEWDVERDEMR